MLPHSRKATRGVITVMGVAAVRTFCCQLSHLLWGAQQQTPSLVFALKSSAVGSLVADAFALVLSTSCAVAAFAAAAAGGTGVGSREKHVIQP